MDSAALDAHLEAMLAHVARLEARATELSAGPRAGEEPKKGSRLAEKEAYARACKRAMLNAQPAASYYSAAYEYATAVEPLCMYMSAEASARAAALLAQKSELDVQKSDEWDAHKAGLLDAQAKELRAQELRAQAKKMEARAVRLSEQSEDMHPRVAALLDAMKRAEHECSWRGEVYRDAVIRVTEAQKSAQKRREQTEKKRARMNEAADSDE